MSRRSASPHRPLTVRRRVRLSAGSALDARVASRRPTAPVVLIQVMRKVMMDVARRKRLLSAEERNLLSVAYKNCVGPCADGCGFEWAG